MEEYFVIVGVLGISSVEEAVTPLLIEERDCALYHIRDSLWREISGSDRIVLDR
jgi:hypothetical protein